MALLSINPFKKERQPSTLEKIAMGVGIAKDVMGSALAIPTFLQNREEFKSNKAFRALQEGQIRSDIGEKTEVAQPGEEGAFEVPGMGLRKPMPSFDRQIKEFGLAEKIRLSKPAKDSDYDLLIKAMPGIPLDSLKNQFPTLGDVNEATNRVLGATTVKVEDPLTREKWVYQQQKDAEAAAKAKEKEKKESEEKLKTLYIPSLDQFASTDADAKEVKESSSVVSNIIEKLKYLINLRKTKGAELLDRDAVANAQSTSTDLLLEFKKLAALGVLSKSDIELVDKLVPSDPLEWNVSSAWGKDPTMSKLNRLGEIMRGKYRNQLKSKGLKVPKEFEDTGVPNPNVF